MTTLKTMSGTGLTALETKASSPGTLQVASQVASSAGLPALTTVLTGGDRNFIAQQEYISRLLAKLGKRSIEEAVVSGDLTADDLVTIGAFDDKKKAEEYISVISRLSDLEFLEPFRTEQGYDLAAAVRQVLWGVPEKQIKARMEAIEREFKEKRTKLAQEWDARIAAATNPADRLALTSEKQKALSALEHEFWQSLEKLSASELRYARPALRQKLVELFGENTIRKIEEKVIAQAIIEGQGGVLEFAASRAGEGVTLYPQESFTSVLKKAGYDEEFITQLDKIRPYLVKAEEGGVAVDVLRAVKDEVPRSLLLEFGVSGPIISLAQQSTPYLGDNGWDYFKLAHEAPSQLVAQLQRAGLLSSEGIGYIRTLQQYTTRDKNLNISNIVNDIRRGVITAEELSQTLGVDKAMLEVLVILEKYRTGTGYNLAAALADKQIQLQQYQAQLVSLFGKDSLETAKQLATIQTILQQKPLEDALRDGSLTPQQCVQAGIFNSVDEATRYQNIVIALSKVRGTKYETEEGYDLVSIIQDKVLSPSEIVLLFGPHPGDSPEEVNSKKQTLMLATEMALTTPKKPAGLAQAIWWATTPWKEEKSQSYLDYVTDSRGRKNYLKGLVAGERIALHIAGPVLISLLPGAIAGTGAAMAGRTAAIASTLSRITGAAVTGSFAALGTYGAYETIKHRATLSPAQITFNMSMSALCLLPLLKVAGTAIQRVELGKYRIQARTITRAEVIARAPTRVPTTLQSLLQLSARRINTSTTTLLRQHYGAEVASAWREMVLTRGKLLDRYIQLLDIERGFVALSKRLRGIIDKKAISTNRQRLQTEISRLEIQLEKQSNRALQAIKEAARLRRVRHLVEEPFPSPRDVVRDTKAMAEAIVRQGEKGNLKALKAAVDAARRRLEAAVKRQQPFGDLLNDLLEKQLIYELAKLGDITQLQARLAQLNMALRNRTLLDIKTLKPLSARQTLRMTPKQKAALYLKMKQMADDLAAKIWREAHTRTDTILEAVRDSDGNVVGYRVPQSLTRGRVAVMIKPPSPPVSAAPSISLLKSAKAKLQLPLTPALGVALITKPSPSITKPSITKPSITKPSITKPSITKPSITKPEIKTLINTAAEVGVQRWMEGATRPEILQAIKTFILNSINLSGQLQSQLQPKLQPQAEELVQVKKLTQLAIKTATARIAELKGRRWKVPPVLLPSSPKAGKVGQGDVPIGSVGWKQGTIYWHIWPEGNKLVAKATRKPIPGIPYREGPRSAYETLRQLHGGELPRLMAMDMGIMDIYITRDGKRPKMVVRPDPKRKTKLGYVESIPRLARAE